MEGASSGRYSPMDKRYSSSISTSSGGSSSFDRSKWVSETREIFETDESSLKLDVRDDGGRGDVNGLSRGGRLELDGVS